MKHKTPSKYGKLFLDLILLVLLALMYQKRAISMHFHEIGGLVLFGLFLVHKALNWQWIRGMTAGLLRRRIRPNARWLVDVLLLLAMTAILVTGLLIAKTLPTAIPGARCLRPWHYFSAALALSLSGIHLGLHAGLLRTALWETLPLPRQARAVTGGLLLCIVLCFGTYSLIRTDHLFMLRQPIVSLSVSREDSHAPFFEEGGHPEGEVPGSGPRDGKGSGGGKGLGKGRGQEAPHTVSPANAFHTVVSYSSILLWYAILTAAAEAGVRKIRNRPAPPRPE